MEPPRLDTRRVIDYLPSDENKSFLRVCSLRTLALDMGEKRIGVAVSDELGFTAQGLDTIQSKGVKADVQAVLELISAKNVSEIVVGMPLNMDGSDGPRANSVRGFMDLLRQATQVPVKEWDERLSTVAAERTLLDANMSRVKRRKVVDKLAAVIILQGYLDSKHFQRTSDT